MENPFTIVRTAPRAHVEEDYREMTKEELDSIYSAARFICGSWSDNDQEVYYFSLGGQFMRVTRRTVYLCDTAYASEQLEDWCDDEQMHLLVAAGAFREVEDALGDIHRE